MLFTSNEKKKWCHPIPDFFRRYRLFEVRVFFRIGADIFFLQLQPPLNRNESYDKPIFKNKKMVLEYFDVFLGSHWLSHEERKAWVDVTLSHTTSHDVTRRHTTSHDVTRRHMMSHSAAHLHMVLHSVSRVTRCHRVSQNIMFQKPFGLDLHWSRCSAFIKLIPGHQAWGDILVESKDVFLHCD